MKLGHGVFTANCITCHGEAGKGDGILAKSLPVKPADLTNPAVWQQSDGALFWKISEGRAPMPTWKALLKEEERWNVINYIRATFGPKVASAYEVNFKTSRIGSLKASSQTRAWESLA